MAGEIEAQARPFRVDALEAGPQVLTRRHGIHAHKAEPVTPAGGHRQRKRLPIRVEAREIANHRTARRFARTGLAHPDQHVRHPGLVRRDTRGGKKARQGGLTIQPQNPAPPDAGDFHFPSQGAGPVGDHNLGRARSPQPETAATLLDEITRTP
jgi:hypothetical protein